MILKYVLEFWWIYQSSGLISFSNALLCDLATFLKTFKKKMISGNTQGVPSQEGFTISGSKGSAKVARGLKNRCH